MLNNMLKRQVSDKKKSESKDWSIVHKKIFEKLFLKNKSELKSWSDDRDTFITL